MYHYMIIRFTRVYPMLNSLTRQFYLNDLKNYRLISELELKYLKNQSKNYAQRAKQIEKHLSSPRHS